MTLKGAIAQLVELENNSTMPEYFKPSIKEVIHVLINDVVERRTGEWADIGGIIRWGCPFCHHAYDAKYNFCPNCGADMRGE